MGTVEARLRAALREEAGEIQPPASLWPQLEARVAQLAPSGVQAQADGAGDSPVIMLDHLARRPLLRPNSRGMQLLWAAAISLVLVALVVVLGRAMPRRSTPSVGGDPVLRTTSLSPLSYGLLVDGRDGRAFVYDSHTGAIDLLDTATGALLHVLHVGGTRGAYFDVDQRAGHVFVTFADRDSLYMLDAHSGALLRTVRFAIPSSQASRAFDTVGPLGVDEASGHVFVTRRDHAVAMLDTRTGNLLRTTPACMDAAALAVSPATGHVFVLCADGTAVVDARSGRVLRTVDTSLIGNPMFLMVDDPAGRVFAAGDRGTAILDARAGTLLHRVSTTGWGEIDPASGRLLSIPPQSPDILANQLQSIVSYEQIVVGMHEVVLVDGKTFAVLRRIQVTENPTDLLVNPKTGHLLVISAGKAKVGGPVISLEDAVPLGPGTLSVIDPRTGVTLRRISVGINPTALAIDSRTNHLFVLNSASTFNNQLLPKGPQRGSLTMLDLSRL
jgi:DNA-binding beta-propeller fold protein YncE